MFDPVLTFEDIATALSMRFIYGAKPFQNWEITQKDIYSGESFLGMFPFRERGSVDNGAVASWSVSTVIWVGRKFDPAGTYSSLDETEKQKYDRRLKYLRALMETILASLCGDTDVEITEAEIFRELNRFDENTDVIGCNLSFTYNPDAENSAPPVPVAIAAGDIAATQLVAKWHKLGADGYYLDVATNSTFTSLVVTNRHCGNYEYSLVTGLTTGTTYYYRVRAYNSTGTSGNSKTITAVTL
jgi:hypothetical protein